MLFTAMPAAAQFSNLSNKPARDTTLDKTNNTTWKNQEATVRFVRLNSDRIYSPDTAVHTFHRRPFIQPWARDMGNPGSPVYNLLFTPEYRVGPSLGYHVSDPFRFNVDSLYYYNTNRPYSLFGYQTAGRQEHLAQIMHTQNILANWNFAIEYRKLNSPGYYKIQRNNHDNAAFTTNYSSLDKHYNLRAAMVYNKQQHDESGGIVNDSFLTDESFTDRRTINTAYQSNYSTTRSAMSNVQRDFTIMLQHGYTWGRTDTTFDEEDTAAYSYTLTPRFSITHNTTVSTEKHTFTDFAPDSVRYVTLFDHAFANNGGGYYAPGNDSVFMQQQWFWADNKVLFNGFLGREGQQLKFSAGAGVRYDQFIFKPLNRPMPDSPFFYKDYERHSRASTFIEGQISKEALTKGSWEFSAATRLYTSGEWAGNFNLSGTLKKKLGEKGTALQAGFSQQLGTAPYSLTNYKNMFTYKTWSFNKESITEAHGSIEIPSARLFAGARIYTVANYIYLADNGQPAQYNNTFTLPQAWARKVFRLGGFYLDNELVYQVTTGSTPVNVPLLMGRHQLSYEHGVFKNALVIATGIEARYNTPYAPAGYNALFNRFYYQDSVTVTNVPELCAFFNFRIKRFRAFVVADNLQQTFARNAILFTGMPLPVRNSTPILPVYAAPNFMIRFGFTWAMVN